MASNQVKYLPTIVAVISVMISILSAAVSGADVDIWNRAKAYRNLTMKYSYFEPESGVRAFDLPLGYKEGATILFEGNSRRLSNARCFIGGQNLPDVEILTSYSKVDVEKCGIVGCKLVIWNDGVYLWNTTAHSWQIFRKFPVLVPV